MPATPGSRLLKMLKQTENQNQIDNQSRIKFIETSGRRYIDHLKIRDPYQENCSSEERCLMCMNSDKQTNCKISNVGYSIMCKTCKDKKVTRSYEGETCRNGYLRGKEHLKALNFVNEIPSDFKCNSECRANRILRQHFLNAYFKSKFNFFDILKANMVKHPERVMTI